MNNYAIIVVAYNRVESLKRLLASLNNAEYFGESVPLIISIDHSGENDVEMFANEFHWLHGEKTVRTFSQRQGLRNHILKCGEYLQEFEAIAVLEDDVVVAPGFYAYLKSSVAAYQDDEHIAGISLYNHLWNVNANLPFQPAYSKYDVYFLQYAQSWGQIWMRKQWNDFMDWYRDNHSGFPEDPDIPAFVLSWPESSWLKYHIKYCIKKNKFFAYPYKALSTCFSDVGTHCQQKNTLYQVPMPEDIQTDYRLPAFSNCPVRYDAFFERIWNKPCIANIKPEDLCMDLYGSRPVMPGKKRFLLSTASYPYKILSAYALERRPQEVNIIEGIQGDDIYLYDTKYVEKSKRKNSNATSSFIYRFRLYNVFHKVIRYVIDKIRVRLLRRY